MIKPLKTKIPAKYKKGDFISLESKPKFDGGGRVWLTGHDLASVLAWLGAMTRGINRSETRERQKSMDKA